MLMIFSFELKSFHSGIVVIYIIDIGEYIAKFISFIDFFNRKHYIIFIVIFERDIDSLKLQST